MAMVMVDLICSSLESCCVIDTSVTGFHRLEVGHVHRDQLGREEQMDPLEIVEGCCNSLPSSLSMEVVVDW